MGSIPGSGRAPGGGNRNPLQYSCLGNPINRGDWWATVHGVTRVELDSVTKQQFLLQVFMASWASLVAQTVKNLPAVRETWVQFLGWEDPLEEGIATHSSILSWRIPMNRGAW